MATEGEQRLSSTALAVWFTSGVLLVSLGLHTDWLFSVVVFDAGVVLAVMTGLFALDRTFG